MVYSRAFVIPESWAKKASTQINLLNDVESFYSILPISNYETQPKARLRNLIKKSLRTCDANNAVVVLPKSYATGVNVKYWPDMFIFKKSEILITSVLFADTWSECSEIINSWAGSNFSENQKHNATCQYQPPYTDTLDKWNKKGAQSFHPGDYFKHEFLQELKKMQGHWLYWGHADSEKLHGFNHLTSAEILNHQPESPLYSTLWFSCSTLGINKKSNIALDWYLNGATYCLFASMKPVNTTDNQLLGLRWLDLCQQPNVNSIADILQNLLKQDQQPFRQVLSNYRLLGFPWVRFS